MAARKTTGNVRKSDEKRGTQNSAKRVLLAAAKKRAPRGKGKPFQPGHPYRFKPGQSGNPGGRPKSLGLAYAEWLEQEWRFGLNNAQAVADAVGKKATHGSIPAAIEIRNAVAQVQQPVASLTITVSDARERLAHLIDQFASQSTAGPDTVKPDAGRGDGAPL